MKTRNALVFASLATAAACASGGKAVNAAGEGDAQQTVIDATGATSYSGDFGRRRRLYGSVRLIFRESTSRTDVQLRLNTNGNQSEILTWGVVPGRCRSGGVPVTPVSQLPALEIGINGQGQINAEGVPLTIPPGATYHVNVYRSGNQLPNVVACANLRTSN